MALIVIVTNKSKLAPVSDYNYEVLVGDGTRERSQVIAKGEVLQHLRSEGWKALVERVLEKET